MILICNWFDKAKVGRVLQISLSKPSSVRCDGKVKLLYPTWAMVDEFKAELIGEEEYVMEYLEILRSRYHELKAWLDGIDEDVTLCCWEPEGEFCHRQIVAWVIGRMRPDVEVVLR